MYQHTAITSDALIASVLQTFGIGPGLGAPVLRSAVGCRENDGQGSLHYGLVSIIQYAQLTSRGTATTARFCSALCCICVVLCAALVLQGQVMAGVDFQAHKMLYD